MEALRKFVKPQNGTIKFDIPNNFNYDEYEMILIPKEDENLQQDPYFYQRQKELKKLRKDIKSGQVKMYEWDDFEEEMDIFEKELIARYENN